jgi:hypothetical protein
VSARFAIRVGLHNYGFYSFHPPGLGYGVSDRGHEGHDARRGHMAVRTERVTGAAPRGVVARLATETKQAFKTTEFWAMVAIVAGILIASWVVDDGGGGDGDAFPAVRAWLYVAIVASAYIVSRGLAKAGSPEPYWADSDDLPGGSDRS